MLTLFKLPDVGEGLHHAIIHEWHVQPKSSIKSEQPLVTIETEKSLIEIPAPCDGLIENIFFKTGDRVSVGENLVEIVTKTSLSIAGNVDQTPIKNKEKSKISALPSTIRAAKSANISMDTLAAWRPHKTLTPKDVNDYLSLKNSPETQNEFVQALQQSWKNLVHTSIFEDILLEENTRDINSHLLKACGQAIIDHPSLNNSWDMESKNLTAREQIILGLAIDTPHGTRIPGFVFKNNSLEDIRSQIENLKEQALGKINYFTDGYSCVISNIGKIAGKYATPILPKGCNFILAIGQARLRGKQKLLPISLTFNHLAMTGADAARFLRSVIKHLPGEIY